LAETLEHSKYRKLSNSTYKKYSDYLDWALGEFILMLKNKGDAYYKLFLNRYGDSTYSHFWIDDHSILGKKGLYAYKTGNELKYIGRCRDNFQRRINLGYGKIYPKNCYLDGRATNCHLNSLITQNRYSISLWICPLDDEEEIMKLECSLISLYNPEWNIASASSYNAVKPIKVVGGNKMVKVRGRIPSNNLTDSIRRYIGENRIEPAKKRGVKEITVRAGDIHDAMGLKSRIPAVCSALKTKIDKMYDVEIIIISEPPSGQGANVYVTYKILE